MGVDWGSLVEQGRAKAIGVSWSDAELVALHELKIPVDLVRKGVLTLEEAKDEVEDTSTKGKMLREMNKEELKTLATELGLEVPVNAKRLEIISLIQNSKLPANSD